MASGGRYRPGVVLSGVACECVFLRGELGVYPRSANTVRKPSAYRANGPLTRTRIALFIIDSSPGVVVEEKSRHKRV